MPAAHAPESSPSPSQESAPPESPEAALSRAEHELNQALAISDERDEEAQSSVLDAAEPASPSPGPRPTASPAAAGSTAEAAPLRAESKAYAEPPPSRCEVACRAYASMGRATESLCDLGGEEEARCVDARSRLKQASVRLHASCGGCGS